MILLIIPIVIWWAGFCLDVYRGEFWRAALWPVRLTLALVGPLVDATARLMLPEGEAPQ